MCCNCRCWIFIAPSFTSSSCHAKTLLVVGKHSLTRILFPNSDDKQEWNEITRKPKAYRDKTRIIHHHPSCRKQITWILIEILFYLHLNYLCGCWLDSYLWEKHEHIMWCKNVCVYLWAFLIYYSKSMVLCSHMKHIKGPVFDTICLRSTGQSWAVHWSTIANEIGG